MKQSVVVSFVTLFLGGIAGWGGRDFWQKQALKKPQPLIEVDQKIYTTDSLPTTLKSSYSDNETKVTHMRELFLKEAAVRLAFSPDPTSSLLPLSEALGVVEPTKTELQAEFSKNRASYPPQITFEAVENSLKQYAIALKTAELMRAKWQELQDTKRVQLLPRSY